MATFVLIHGSWEGGWAWYKVVSRLEQAGHIALAPDLPGMGKDKTPLADVTLELWTNSVCQLLDAQPGPVVLVGHSRGGYVISQVAEHRPQKIQRLVYLCAFLLPSGTSLLGRLRQGLKGSMTVPEMIIDDVKGYRMVPEQVVKAGFQDDCPADDVTLAKLLAVPEPNAPAATPLRLTDANFGRVPRVYIECLRDNAIPPAVQREMYTVVPCQKVITMDTSHSPNISAPDELVAHLISLIP
jgi:pimeloyl-ACP methyl ester carboxylesterase